MNVIQIEVDEDEEKGLQTEGSHYAQHIGGEQSQLRRQRKLTLHFLVERVRNFALDANVL